MHCFDALWPEDLLTVNTNLGLIVICLLRLSFFQWLRPPAGRTRDPWSLDVLPYTRDSNMATWHPLSAGLCARAPYYRLYPVALQATGRGGVVFANLCESFFVGILSFGFFITFARMANLPFLPSSFNDLAVFLSRQSERETIVWYRAIGLLASRTACDKCGTETELELPDSDQQSDIKRFSICSNKECADTHRSRRTLFFKRHSIFENFPQTPMQSIVQLIFCFTFIIPPADAAVLVGGQITAVHASRVYSRVRLAAQWFNNVYYRRRMGGMVVPGDEDEDISSAVYYDGKLRYVVEYDECK